MKNLNGFYRLCAIFCFVSHFIQAQGTVFVSNLNQTTVASAPIASDAYIARRIITGTSAGGYFLNQIQLSMASPTGGPAGFNVSIYSGSGGSPGTSLGTLTGPAPSAGGIFTYDIPGLFLQPSTSYFVVLTAATAQSPGAYAWNAANTFTQGTDFWDIDDLYYSSTNGTSWTPTLRQDVFQLAIEASAAPEPATLSLLGLGAVGLVCAVKKRI